MPVNVLQKRKKRLLSQAREARDRIKQKSKKRTGKQNFLRAEKFVKNYRKVSKDKLRIRRQARFIAIKKEDENQDKPKLGLVIRLAPSIPMTDKSNVTLKELHLHSLYSASFVLLNQENLQKVKLVEPYVTWGYPNLKTVRELIFKRGHCKSSDPDGEDARKIIELTDNVAIEKELGHLGIICIEDLVHEIFTLSSNFDQVVEFLSHFRLNKPESRLRGKSTHFNAGGSYGFRGDEINHLVQSMI